MLSFSNPPKIRPGQVSVSLPVLFGKLLKWLFAGGGFSCSDFVVDFSPESCQASVTQHPPTVPAAVQRESYDDF